LHQTKWQWHPVIAPFKLWLGLRQRKIALMSPANQVFDFWFFKTF
jgi:hypothetical protein